MYKEVVGAVGSHFHHKRVKTTGIAFKVLTRFTVNLLVCSALIISLRQFFGDPITCATTSEHKQAIELSCWIDGVYIDEALINGTIGKDITRYGVGPTKDHEGRKYIQQNYYMWIIPVLLLQSLILYTPRVIWRLRENGLMTKLLDNTDSLIVNNSWKEQKKLIVRFMKEVGKKSHRRYVLSYYACEVLAFSALILNMYIMHQVFYSFWISYHPAVSALINKDFTDFSRYAARLFPTQAKCIFYKFGASGGTETRDALCFLPQNTVNEKIFAFFYIWFLAILVFMTLSMIGSTLMLALKCLREKDIRRMSNRTTRVHDEFYDHYSDYGYWFTIHILHKNLNPVLFKDLLEELVKVGPRTFRDEETSGEV